MAEIDANPQKFRRSQTQRQTVTIEQTEISKADPAKAKRFQEEMMLNQLNEFTGNLEPYPLCTPQQELGQYGTGLRLFFHFNKWLAVVFWIMALTTIPALVSNLSGDGMDAYGERANKLARLSLANQPQLSLALPQTNATDSQISAVDKANDKSISQFVDDQHSQQLMVIIPDMIYSIIFLIFLGAYRQVSRKIINQIKAKNVLPNNYTIEVTRFDPEITNESIIKSHFQQFGEIVQCQLGRNYHGTLFLHREEADLIFQIMVEQSKAQQGFPRNTKLIDKMTKRLIIVEDKVEEIIKKNFGQTLKHDEYPALKAYVVFNSIAERNECLRQYARLNNYFFCKPKWENRYKLLEQHELLVVPCRDDPSNIRWENLDISTLEQCGRNTVVILLVILLMLITFGIIMLANIVKPTNTAVCPQNMTMTLAEAKAANSQLITSCWCKNQSTSDILNNQDINDFCEETYLQGIYTFVLTIVTGFVVWLVNFLLQWLLNKLGQFARYSTMTKKTIGITIKLFVVTFINTAMIGLILQADIFDFKPAIYISEPIPPLKKLQELRQNQFSPDFDRDWYIEIGSKITTTMAIAIFNPHCIMVLLTPLLQWLRLRKAQKSVIQRDMNNNSVGPAFELTHFAIILNTVFVTLFYSSGIPVLIWFCAATLTLMYWSFQYLLLRFNKRPPAYDKELMERIQDVLPIAMIFHLAIGIYMYGSPMIFPNDSSQISSSVNNSLSQNGISTIQVSTEQGQVILTRAFNVIYMTVLFIAVLIFYILDITVFKILTILWDSKQSNQVAPSNLQKQGTYQEELDNMSKRMLCTYDIQDNQDYKDIIQAIDNEANHVIGSPLDTHKIKSEQDQALVLKDV